METRTENPPLNLNQLYEAYKANPASETEEALYKGIIKYARKYVSRQFGGQLGYYDNYEDAISETALKVFTSLVRYNGDMARFSTWVYQIVKNSCLDLSRRYTTRNGSLLHEGIEDPSGWGLSDGSLVLESLMESCNDNEKALIGLKLKGFEDAEIAEKTGLPVGTIKSRWFYLKNKLKKLRQN